jgi:predicted amidohydrolase YtcJ
VKKFAIVFVMLMLPILAQSGASKREQPADLILNNGHVSTQDPSQPSAEAVAVKGGRIVFVGTNADATAWRGRATKTIDLAGRTLLPGLSDAHVHPMDGEFLHRRLCDVRGITVEEGLRKMKHCAEIAPPGDWVIGYGWYDLDTIDYDKLTRAQLESLVPDRKMAVIARDHHTVWVNPRVLASLGIDKNTPTPPGGNIIRDPVTKQPTGMLIDAAIMPVIEQIVHHSNYSASIRDLLQSSLQHLNTFGITSIIDAKADEAILRAYLELDRAGKLNTRVVVAMGVTPTNFRTEIPLIAERRKSLQSTNVHVGFIKVFGDGNPEVGLASMLLRDGRPGSKSPGYYTDKQMHELLALAETYQLPVFVHVIGDGATRQALDAIEAARKAHPQSRLRHTLTHLCWVDEHDMPRFKQLGVIANLQEGWLAPSAFGGPPGYDYARSTAAGPIGPWLGGRTTPYRGIVDAGARIASGSVWFYTDENPWNNLEAGATSMDPGGSNRVPMLPNYTVDVPRLLAAKTSGAAYQVGREDDLGMIRTGYRADLVVVDRDPLAVSPQTLHDTRVDMTLFEGRVIYKRQ